MPWKPIDEVGNRYGRLTVIAIAGRQGRKATFECRCDCGSASIVTGVDLRSGHSKSCGCLRGDVLSRQRHRHGQSNPPTPEYASYQSARGRCTNPRNKAWGNYGRRGIEMRFSSFEEFLAHIGPRPPGTTLDRIDNNRGYEPGNVRWATPSVQASNRRPYKHIHPRSAEHTRKLVESRQRAREGLESHG
jgi:hypothetical protein